MAEYIEDDMEHVLIIEDSDTTRELLKNVLETEGFEISEACTGFQAIKELQVRSYDLIITDINMPDLTGLEIIKFARSGPVHRNTPIIVISTDSQNRDRERAVALGANRYITKPFDPDEFLETCLETIKQSPLEPDKPKKK